MQVTVQTRIDERETDGRTTVILDAFSELMNGFERKLHTKLMSGRKWTGDLAVSLYKDFGITAKLAESAYYSLQGKLGSASELAKLNGAELEEKISAKRAQIKDKTKKVEKTLQEMNKALDRLSTSIAKVAQLKDNLDKAKPAQQAKALQRYKSELGTINNRRQVIADSRDKIKRLRADLHQHKRHIETLEQKHRNTVARFERPSICFGTKKLFKAHFNLQKNGYSSHADWKNAWVRARSSTFIIEGLASAPQGNKFAKLHPQQDGRFDLELRLPENLKHLSQQSSRHAGRDIPFITIKGLEFHHRIEELKAALIGNVPISVRFHRDETSWRILVGFKVDLHSSQEDYSCGAVAIDLNAGFAAVARVDRHGNVVETFDLPMETYGKAQGQSKTIVNETAAKIATYAAKHGLPVVTEKLDFSKKKLALGDQSKPRYARMLSSFVYSAFDAALSSACARSGVYHRRVNPAFTSIIGRTKFASRYGLSVHAAAAIAIARRAMKLSEKLPLSFKENVVTLPLNDAHHVTLELPERKDTDGSQANVGPRHVWSDWMRVHKALRQAVAPRRPSRRKPRSIMGRNELHSMVCRRRKDVLEASSQSVDQRVGPMPSAGNR